MSGVRRYQIRLYDDRHGELIERLDAYLEQKREIGIPANFALAELLSAALSCWQPDGGYQVLLAEIRALHERLNRGIIYEEENPKTEPEQAARGLNAMLEKFGE